MPSRRTKISVAWKMKNGKNREHNGRDFGGGIVFECLHQKYFCLPSKFAIVLM